MTIEATLSARGDVSKWRWFGVLAKAGASFTILAVLLARADVGRVAALLASVHPAAVAAVLVLIVVQTLVTAYRWVLVMGGVDVRVPLWPGIQTLFASLFINQCVPSYVGGDAYRVYWLYRGGHRLAPVVRGVLIDRVSALIALVLMMVVSLPRLFARLPDGAVDAGMAMVASAGVVGTVVFFSCDVLPRSWRSVAMIAQLGEMSVAARRILLTGRHALAIGALAFLVHALSAGVMYVLASDMAMPLAFMDCLLLVPPIMLLSAVPISIAGWGVREGVMVGALGMMGIGSDRALALSLLLGVVTLVNSLLGIWPLASKGDRSVAARSS